MAVSLVGRIAMGLSKALEPDERGFHKRTTHAKNNMLTFHNDMLWCMVVHHNTFQRTRLGDPCHFRSKALHMVLFPV